MDAPRYKTTRLHAVGGIGRVWLAWDSQLEREVALKDLRPDRAGDPAIRARFLREAHITGQLEHPGIVPVYEMGTSPESGQPFYTMRFVQGRTLAVALQHLYQQGRTPTPLELRELLTAFVTVCNILAYAHSKGILHRDLKPLNVILGDYGEVVLLDWGLARRFQADPTAGDPDAATVDFASTTATGENAGGTEPGRILGTPAYMAPEQADGRVAQFGPATDVYGLGAILCQILTGHPPYSGATLNEILDRVRTAEPDLPSRGIPRPLLAICTKALAKQPTQRYADAGLLADDLRRYLADEPVSAYREPLLARAARWARRHRTFAVTTATVALVLLVGGTALSLWRSQVQEALRRQVAERVAVGRAAAEAGAVDRAVTALSEAAGLCRQSPALERQHQTLDDHLQALERYRDFRQQARDTLQTGFHTFRSREWPDPLLTNCEQALAIYDIGTGDWKARLDAEPLTSTQRAEVRTQVADLLLLAALRLGLFHTEGAAGTARVRRGLTLLDHAAQLEPPTASVWMLRHLWLSHLGEQALAEAARAKLADAGPARTARDHFLTGSLYLQVFKEPRKAVAAYQMALKFAPAHYGAHFGTFLALADLKEPRSQLAPLTACLVLRPDDPELYYFRGMVHFELEQYPAAYHDFDAAVARNPRYKLGHFYRGRMLIVREAWADAEADFTRALEIDPTFTHVLSWRAVARARLDRHREAVVDAERSVRQEPKEPLTLFYAARAYAQCVRAAAGSADLARKYGDRCIELLRLAFANGFAERNRLDEGGDFDPVRARPDFQAVIKPR